MGLQFLAIDASRGSHSHRFEAHRPYPAIALLFVANVGIVRFAGVQIEAM